MVEFEKMKLSQQSHDSDKEFNKTLKWLRGLVDSVGTVPHGKIVYVFLLKHLKWTAYQENTTSSLLNDPSFGKVPVPIVDVHIVDDDAKSEIDIFLLRRIIRSTKSKRKSQVMYMSVHTTRLYQSSGISSRR